MQKNVYYISVILWQNCRYKYVENNGKTYRGLAKRNETKKSVLCEMKSELCEMNLYFAKWKSVLCEMKICTLRNEKLCEMREKLLRGSCHATLLALTLTRCRSVRYKQDVLKPIRGKHAMEKLSSFLGLSFRNTQRV